jgi:dTDP-4-dehydrorhamnose reductase
LTILRLATEREELKIVCDQNGSPTCAADIAAATGRILTSIYGQHPRTSAFGEVTGTYHMTAAGQTTWYEFAKAILEHASAAAESLPWAEAATKGRPLVIRRLLPISSGEYRSAACRPANSVLSNSLLFRTFRVALPAWSTQLQQCFAAESRDGHAVAAGSIPRL